MSSQPFPLVLPGREILESQDGSTPGALAPSAVPSERFHVMPRAMTAGVRRVCRVRYTSPPR